MWKMGDSENTQLPELVGKGLCYLNLISINLNGCNGNTLSRDATNYHATILKPCEGKDEIEKIRLLKFKMLIL